MRDEFMFHKWTTEALLARRKQVIEYLKQCKAYKAELNSLNKELLIRKIDIEKI